MKTNTLRKKRKNVPLEREALSIKRHFFSPLSNIRTNGNTLDDGIPSGNQHQPCTQRVALLFSSLTGQRFSFMGELEACWFNERGPRVAVTLLPSNVIILRTVARNRHS